jgi:predicted MFS family arabinose efflux permease
MRLHTFDSFQERPFRPYWAAVLLTSSGEWLQQLVVVWMMYEMTRSSLLTTLALGLPLMPSLLGAPFGGVLADRWDRTKVLATAYALQSTLTVGFSAIVISGRNEPWHVFAFILAMGLLQSISWPARQAIVPRIVRREYLFNAFAISMLTSSSTRLVVPVAAGLLIALIGPGRTLLAGASMYLTASVIVATIQLRTIATEQTQPRSVVEDFLDGARYVRKDPVLFPVILLGAATYTLIVPAVHGLMPVYASDIFKVGPAGLGLMMSALGLGGTLGTLFLASIRDIKYKGRFMIGCLALMVLAALSFSRISVLVIALPLLVIVNGGFDTFAALRSATIQVVSPDALRGRVSAVNQMGSGLLGLGSLLVGVAADLVGAPSTTLIAALIMLVCIVCITLQYKRIWTF